LAENKKVIKFRKPFNFHINIGLVIFAVILFYCMFYIYSYFTKEHTSIYEVVNGTIAFDTTYKGFAIREEEIVYSDKSGYVNYFLMSGSKTGAYDLVCSVDENGMVSSQINSTDSVKILMQDEYLNELKNSLEKFTYSYDSSDFKKVYTFKNNFSDNISEIINTNALATVLQTNSMDLSSFNRLYSPKDGLVSYVIDNYEGITVDTFNLADYNPSNYSKTNLKMNETVSSGSPIYKLTTNENWNLLVPIDTDMYNFLHDKSVITIRFLDDNVKAITPFTIMNIDGKNFLNLAVRTGMSRYVDQRYIDIELMINEEKGLKIPNSSIIKKDFYIIPTDCFTTGGDSNNLGLILVKYDENNEPYQDFKTPTIYFEKDDYYYVDGEYVQAGDTIQYKDSQKTYTISETDQLKGVYNINKGYAVFKQIDFIYQNDEYSIIKSGTKYGVSLYDHIALDSSTISENAIVN